MNDTLKLEYAEFVAKGTQGKNSFAPNQTGIFFGFSLMNFNNRDQILSGSMDVIFQKY